MNLYLICQNVYNTWNTYDSCVVCARSEESARKVRPDKITWKQATGAGRHWRDRWVKNPKDVTVKYIGKADKGVKPGVVLASFNEG